jgi:opacity protein-like surface antigen
MGEHPLFRVEERRSSLIPRPLKVHHTYLLLLMLSPLVSHCQSNTQARAGDKPRETSISIGAFGQMTPSRAPFNITNPYGPSSDYEQFEQKRQSSSPSLGVLGSFHQSFGRFLGYDVYAGYTRFRQSYSDLSGFLQISNPNVPVSVNQHTWGSVGTNLIELTVAYSIDGPRSRWIRTFTEVGGGGLFFLPYDGAGAHDQTRPALLFGGGVEYRLSDHLGLRAEYRGHLLKGPDFATSGPQRLFTVMNTPAISLVYRFGHKQ